MDRFDLVDKLVKSTGVRYEDAKNALDASGWDILDAAVRLEKEGKTACKSARMDTSPRKESEGKKTNRAEDNSDFAKSTPNNGIFKFCKTVFMDNEVSFYRSNGETFLEIPVWLMLILLLVAFWPVLFVILLFFFLGYRFRFTGPVLGNKAVNNILDFIENAGGALFQKLKNLSQKTDSTHNDSCQQPRNQRDNCRDSQSTPNN